MNKLIFDPNKSQVLQWHPFYYCQEALTHNLQAVNRAHSYIQVVKRNNKRKFTSNKNITSLSNISSSVIEDLPTFSVEQIDLLFDPIIQANKRKNIDAHRDLQKIHQSMHLPNHAQNIVNRKQQKDGDTLHSRNEIVDMMSNLSLNHEKVFRHQRKLIEIKQLAIDNMQKDFQIQTQLISNFTNYKLKELTDKLIQLKKILARVGTEHSQCFTLFENIFIESNYLANYLKHNRERITSEEQQYDNFKADSTKFRSKQILNLVTHYNGVLLKLCEEVSRFKKQVRQLYFFTLKKKTDEIRDHLRLQRHIIHQIAVNMQQFEPSSSFSSFISGMSFGLLLFALAIILIFRFINAHLFQQDSSYLQNFKVWRGASYMLYFNWIIAFIFLLCQKFKINYQLILLEGNCFVPPSHSFFLTATLMTAIYLLLFGLFIINELGLINVDYFTKLGYIQWILNIIFLFNPFKILNYEGRKFFICLFAKILVSPFRQMKVPILFLSIIIASWAQPFSDFSFAVCKLIYDHTSTCQSQAKLATYIFMAVFVTYRMAQSIRGHFQLHSSKLITRPVLGFINSLFVLNTATAAFVYNRSLDSRLQIYWICSVILSTIVGLNTDFRADWGLILQDQQDKFLRKHLHFSRHFYMIVMAVDIGFILSEVLTTSNNTAEDWGLNMVYFLMILSYVELARRGLWMFIRLQDRHMDNVANFRALQSDAHLYELMKNLSEKQESEINILGGTQQQGMINRYVNEANTFRSLQNLLQQKKKRLSLSHIFRQELEEVLTHVSDVYDKLGWQDQF